MFLSQVAVELNSTAGIARNPGLEDNLELGIQMTNQVLEKTVHIATSDWGMDHNKLVGSHGKPGAGRSARIWTV
jgi:hypothetical protein